MGNSRCVTHTSSYRVTVRRDYVDMFDGDHCAASLLGIFEFATNGEMDRRILAQEPGDPWIKASVASLASDAIGLYSERSIADRLGWIKELGFLECNSQGGGKVNQYLFNFRAISESLKLRKCFKKSDCKIAASVADEKSEADCKTDCKTDCKNDIPIIKEELRTKNKEYTPPTPSEEQNQPLE